MRILIYQDYVHNHGVLFKSLSRHFGAGTVDFIDAQGIIAGGLNAAVDLFVMPGGADLYYVEKLNGAGNRAIRGWVEAGGTYLGICAGAYYACARCDWASKEDGAIVGNRELGFYNGAAIGPVYHFIEDGDFKKSWYGSAMLSYDDGTTSLNMPVLYSGGPVFSGGRATVLARYAELSGACDAIIEVQVGKGKALLCSPHLESDADALPQAIYQTNNKSHAWQMKTADSLKSQATDLAALRHTIFERAVA